MKINLIEYDNDTTTVFDYTDQLLASKKNTITGELNPMGETIIMCRIGKRMVQKSSSEAKLAHKRHKLLSTLVRKFSVPSYMEKEIIQLCLEYLKIQTGICKKIKALVAAAIYAVKRKNNSSVSLQEILEKYKVSKKEINKFLRAYKELKLFEVVPNATASGVLEELVDKLFPYSSLAKTEENAEFSIGLAPTPDSLSFMEKLSVREKLIKTSQVLMADPNVELSKQGKMPQSVAAGVLAVVAEYLELPLRPREIAEKIGVSYSTTLESKKHILSAVSNLHGKAISDAETGPRDDKTEERIMLDSIFAKALL